VREAGYTGRVTEPADPFVVPSVPRSVAEVRRYAVGVCTSLGREQLVDVLALLVSEVTTNAVVHGAGSVGVRVLGTDGGVRVEVTDESTAVPVVRRADTEAEGGRGLALVEALAVRWGVLPLPDGKTVWFEV
jgi:anti-sigma regulatory factor (Ser/Thr protein kinase)